MLSTKIEFIIYDYINYINAWLINLFGNNIGLCRRKIGKFILILFGISMASSTCVSIIVTEYLRIYKKISYLSIEPYVNITLLILTSIYILTGVKSGNNLIHRVPGVFDFSTVMYSKITKEWYVFLKVIGKKIINTLFVLFVIITSFCVSACISFNLGISKTIILILCSFLFICIIISLNICSMGFTYFIKKQIDKNRFHKLTKYLKITFIAFIAVLLFYYKYNTYLSISKFKIPDILPSTIFSTIISDVLYWEISFYKFLILVSMFFAGIFSSIKLICYISKDISASTDNRITKNVSYSNYKVMRFIEMLGISEETKLFLVKEFKMFLRCMKERLGFSQKAKNIFGLVLISPIAIVVVNKIIHITSLSFYSLILPIILFQTGYFSSLANKYLFLSAEGKNINNIILALNHLNKNLRKIILCKFCVYWTSVLFMVLASTIPMLLLIQNNISVTIVSYIINILGYTFSFCVIDFFSDALFPNFTWREFDEIGEKGKGTGIALIATVAYEWLYISLNASIIALCYKGIISYFLGTLVSNLFAIIISLVMFSVCLFIFDKRGTESWNL